MFTHKRRSRRLPRERKREEGGLVTVEWVIVFPVMFFVILVILQFGLWIHASHVASAAAQEGARAARAEDGSAEAGSDRARAFIRGTGAQVLLGPRVDVSRGSDVATVKVSGQAVSIVPLPFDLPVNEKATQTVERFRPDGSST
jgi:Flp pilus assembly protein TadG